MAPIPRVPVNRQPCTQRPSSTGRTIVASRYSTRSGMTWWAERKPTSSSLATPDVVGHLTPGPHAKTSAGAGSGQSCSIGPRSPARDPADRNVTPRWSTGSCRSATANRAARVVCHVLCLIWSASRTTDDDTTGGADRDAVAQQRGCGTGLEPLSGVVLCHVGRLRVRVLVRGPAPRGGTGRTRSGSPLVARGGCLLGDWDDRVSRYIVFARTPRQLR
jgi:hypothetical protein